MAKSKRKKSAKGSAGNVAEVYTHPDQTLLMRPEVGTQAQFRKKKPPQTYRYDSSLSPALDWDGGNGARELGEWLLGVIERAATLESPHVLPFPAELMNSLLHDERLGGQVQMIYIDPPYGVKFGSNFQPFVRKRDVSRGADEDLTREPEMPCWMLDADYNGLCFRASQVFFPRTAACDSLKKALKADYEETLWDHLAGARSAPFEAGEQKQVAVKVIDDRGNELLVVKALP